MKENDTTPSHSKPSKSGFTISLTTGLSVLAVVLLILSFAAGMQYQKSKHSSMTVAANGQGQRRFGGGFGGFQRGNRAIGTVSAISSTSITVNTRTGASKTYTITSNTTVTNGGQAGSIGDVQVGDQVFLTLASTGSTNVAAIELNPTFNGPSGQGTVAPSTSDTSDNSSI